MLRNLLAASTAFYLLLAGPAAADPVIGGIGALLATQIGTAGLTVGSIAFGVALTGAQWLVSRLLTPDPKQRGVKAKMETGGDNPPKFIFGEYATAGQLVYANTLDKGDNIPEQLLVMVVMLSCLPCESVSSELFINNERCHLNTGSTWPGGFYEVDEYIKGGDDGGYCLQKFHLGGQNNSDGWMLDKFGNDPDRPWSNDMFLPGCTYAIVQCWWSNRGIWTGLPTFRWVVRGAKWYDPRRDGSVGGTGPQRWNNPNTWTFSKNPKVIEYNFIRGVRYGGEHVWGGDAEAYRLPLEYWFAAMNACDVEITKKNGDVIPTFEVGGEIALNERPIDVIAELNKSCSGYTTEYGGTYKTWVGIPSLSVGTITDDDFLITAEMESNLFQPRETTFNAVYTTYPEPRQQWEVKDGPRWQMADALAEDGEELPIDLALPYVSESNQAQRLGRAVVKDSRRQVTHAGQLPPRAWVWEPFDRLTYKSEMFGYGGNGKDFIIASKDDLPNVNQQILLREINPNDQGHVPADEQDFDTAPLVVIRPGVLDLDVDLFPDQTDSPRGKDKPAIRVEWSWGGADVDVMHLDWRLRRPGTTKVIAQGKIKKVDDGEAIISPGVLRFGKTYELQFRPEPFSIRDSKWTGWKSVTCMMVDVPGRPTLTPVSQLGPDGRMNYFVDVAWTEVDAEGSYLVRAVVDGVPRRYPADASPLRFSIVPAPGADGSTVIVDVVAIAADGTRGDWSETRTITFKKKLVQPAAPTSLTATGKIGRNALKTTKHPERDFAHWNLYGSDYEDFSGVGIPTAQLIDDPKSIRFEEGDLGNEVTRYYWITAVDNSGNESVKFPAGKGRSATTKQVVADDLHTNAVERRHVKNKEITWEKLDDDSVDTDKIRLGSVEGQKSCGERALKIRCSKNPLEPSLNWSGDASGQVKTEVIPIGKKVTVNNAIGTKIEIGYDLKVRNNIVDDDGGAFDSTTSYVYSRVVIQSKKTSQGSNKWRAVKGVQAANVRSRASGGKTIEPSALVKRNSTTQVLGYKGSHDFRVVLIVQHRRGNNRSWITCEIHASGHASFVWRKV